MLDHHSCWKYNYYNFNWISLNSALMQITFDVYRRVLIHVLKIIIHIQNNTCVNCSTMTYLSYIVYCWPLFTAYRKALFFGYCILLLYALRFHAIWCLIVTNVLIFFYICFMYLIICKYVWCHILQLYTIFRDR